jgi:hypothetical protein
MRELAPIHPGEVFDGRQFPAATLRLVISREIDVYLAAWTHPSEAQR